ncbi:transmembrane protein [Stylonychia lemnae]|uniref:Transmembrane protein n=1 Tax=Stylonychia lemnae TaxID=5949 RepID=A0A077ZVS6_STYLE|nr:transmembrane protein [Stylonychia lemnae]|eukprot:CDW74045.1 transmembrane protein [Stylonychia lemnae]
MLFLNKKVEDKTTQEYVSTWARNTRGLNNLMNTSKGRDKFCQLIQYTANLYVTCMKNSDEFSELVKQKKVLSVNRAKSIEDNISNGRKIFRFLLFLNEFNELHLILKNKKTGILLKVLKIMSSICSFYYYLFDNIVWFTQIGILNKFILSNFKWKKFKDLFSLWKTILEIIISIYVVTIKQKKEKEILNMLIDLYCNKKIMPNTQCCALLRKLIVIRRKIRFHQMEVFIYSMRMIMLISSLKLIGHRYLDPIFVSICGLLQAISVVFKSLKGKKKFYKLTIKESTESGKVQENTMILTQKEFETRERSLSQSGYKKAISTTAAAIINTQQHIQQQNQKMEIDDFFNIDEEDTQNQTPPRDQIRNMPTISVEQEFQRRQVLPEFVNQLSQSQEEEDIALDQKLIDDVYDINVVKPNYVLYCLREKIFIRYDRILRMQEDQQGK